jgi:hypothetical protein
MSSELPAVEAKSGSESVLVESAVTETSNMPLTPQSAKYEVLKSLNDIRSTRDLTEDGVRDIMRRYTRDHSLELVHLGSLADMSGLNDAFNSCICSMDVNVKQAGSAEEKQFHFVIKSPPKSRFIKMMHKFSRPFYNEVTWYQDLVPLLELANGKGCIDRLLPRCYFAYSNYYMDEAGGRGPGCCERRNCPWFCFVPCKPSEVGILILENIKHRESASYRMFDKRTPMDLNHIKLIMHELANFHGMWLKYKFMSKSGALADKVRRGSDGHPEVMALSWDAFERRHNTQKRMPKLIYSQLKKVAKRTVLRILAQCGADEAVNADKCRHFFNHTATRWLNEYFQEDPKPVYTLCHGDFWSNNILFSYGDDSSCPRDLVIIDYQLINVGNPCYDLVYFLYLNTDLAFRDEHLMICLRLYYDQFATYFDDHLKYSFEEFIEDFNRFKAIGFTTACSVMPNILSDNKVDLEGNPITAFAELQRKQVCTLY